MRFKIHPQNLIENSFIPYSFNGMEKDDEVKGEGNSYNFGARMLDARVGRWLSVDPFANKYVNLSPYTFVANSVLKLLDPNGKEIVLTGDDEDFAKLKAVLENHFEGTIEFSRNENNVLVMNIKANNSELTGMSDDEWNKKVATQMDKPAYDFLGVIISDPESAKFEIFSDSKNYHGGGFRGGDLSGDHYLDVGDAMARIDWAEASGAGLIIHEFVEGYNDQVIRGSVPVSNQEELGSEFMINHQVGLQAQADVNGFDMQFNQGSWSDRYGYYTRVFSVTKGENGQPDQWTMTEFYQNSAKNQQPTLLREGVKIKNVQLNEENTKVTNYEEEH